MPRYIYEQYNPGQYPGEVQAQFDAKSDAGWHVHTALPAYNEIYILWERADEPAKAESDSAPKRRSTKTETRDGAGSAE